MVSKVRNFWLCVFSGVVATTLIFNITPFSKGTMAEVATSEETIIIKINDGDPLLVSKQRLLPDSRVFRYLITELKYEEIEMDDFRTDTVILFLAVLDDKKLEEIEEPMFREIHKVGVVFEVNWLRNDCRRWLKSKIDSAEEDREKVFVLEECWFILKKWEDRDLTNKLVSTLSHKDNSTFISDYMSDIDKLEFGQIDIMLDLGGCDTYTFLMIILHNVTGQTTLSKNVKYVLENMNLVSCCELNEELYYKVMETISDLPEITVTDLRTVNKLIANTARLVMSRKEQKSVRTTELWNSNIYEIIFSCTNLSDITGAVSRDLVTSMFMVVYFILFICLYHKPDNEEQETFRTTLNQLSSEKKILKISRAYLDNIISALKLSNVEQSDLVVTLLTKIRDSEMLCSNNENVIIKRHDKITVRENREYKDLFVFKHPLSRTCTESDSKCGFIVRWSLYGKSMRTRMLDFFGRPIQQNSTQELCVDEDDYRNMGIHLHDVISARDMFCYVTFTGTHESKQITVPGWWLRWWKYWLPNITDWKIIGDSVAYNISDYLVAKRK